MTGHVPPGVSIPPTGCGSSDSARPFPLPSREKLFEPDGPANGAPHDYVNQVRTCDTDRTVSHCSGSGLAQGR